VHGSRRWGESEAEKGTTCLCILSPEAITMSNELKNESTPNQSLWAATAKMPTYSPLKENIHADVCIVGAGIAGLTTAYLLTQMGKSVVLLDDGSNID
jgi:NADPH-dependent 2,4-dienoyl-CoA reductase/sulfur reductase-like enzyme